MEVESIFQDSSGQNITRSSVKSFKKHWLFGDLLEQLDLTVLPTKLDILKNYFYLKNFLLHLKNVRQLKDDEKIIIYDSITRETQDIWRNSSIPIIEEKFVRRLITKQIEKAEYLASRRKSDHETNIDWIQQTISGFNELLDCAKCRCFSKTNNVNEIDDSICKCDDISKIPHIASKDFTDLEFYVDQKTTRKFGISWMKDKTTSQKLYKIAEKFETKKRKAEEKSEKVKRQKLRENASFDNIDDFESLFENIEPNENENLDKPSNTNQKATRNRYEFEESMEIARRYDISLNATTALMNAHTKDLSKIIGFSPEPYFVSQNKMDNTKSKYGAKLIASHDEATKNLVCIGIDGKGEKQNQKLSSRNH